MKNCTGILCPMQCGTVDPATCQAVDYCPQATPPKTNADRIRAMSDEELAEWLYEMRRRLTCIPDIPIGKCEEKDCKKCYLEWIKQEVAP